MTMKVRLRCIYCSKWAEECLCDDGYFRDDIDWKAEAVDIIQTHEELRNEKCQEST